MANPIAIWQEEHANFARLLDLLETQVAAFHAGERPNYDLMADILYYLRSFSDKVHHLREDVAFRRLLARDPGLAPVVQGLQQEHRVIGVAGADLSRRIDESRGDVMVRRDSLEAAAATFLVYYRNHIAAEEGTLIPRAAQLLTPEDWGAVVTALPETPDPLFGQNVDVAFRELRRQIDREADLPPD